VTRAHARTARGRSLVLSRRGLLLRRLRQHFRPAQDLVLLVRGFLRPLTAAGQGRLTLLLERGEHVLLLTAGQTTGDQGGLTVDLVGLLGAADDVVVGVTGQLQGASGLQLAGVAAFLITDVVVAEGHVHTDVDGTAAVAAGVVHGVAPRAVRAGFT